MVPNCLNSKKGKNEKQKKRRMWRQKTEKMFLSIFVVCKTEKLKFIKEQENSGLKVMI